MPDERPRGKDKRVALAELPAFVGAGATVALGGAWLSNHPMAAVRELVRAGVGDLHVVETMASIDVDLLIGAGLVGELTFSMVSLEAFGLPPHFRAAVEQRRIRTNEVSGVALNTALEAGARNLPYLPMRDLGGSDLPARQPARYRALACPFSGEPLLAIAALRPDVAIVHALRADVHGNAQYDGPFAIDPVLAGAARTVVVTCEELVAPAEIAAAPDRTRIPGFLVDAVIEAPFGAHPTTHVPRYGLDAWAILDHVEASADPARWREHLATLAGEDEPAYRERVLARDRERVLRALARTGAVLQAEAA